MNNPRIKTWIGSSILLGATLALVLLLASPSVARPAKRISAVLWSSLSDERESDLLVTVETTKGVHVGDPVFFVQADGDARPIAHVAAMDPGTKHVRVRFAPDEDPAGPWSVRVYPPKTRLDGRVPHRRSAGDRASRRRGAGAESRTTLGRRAVPGG